MAHHDHPTVIESTDWAALDHCGARNVLERAGWRFLAAGDWAVVLAEPAGRWAARISPFELAYQHYVAICHRLADNPYTPVIMIDSELAGGGHLVIMEQLAHRDLPESDDVDPLWESTDADLRTLRTEVERVDRECRDRVPWWGGTDLKNQHFMTTSDGSLRLVDPFYVDGGALSAAARDDYSAFCARIPPDRHQHLLQLPHFSQPYARDDLIRLRAVINPG